MANGLIINVDTKEFDKTFREYMNYTSRDFAEACNQHAYYIARNAVNVTPSAKDEKIAAELHATSDKYSPAPIGAIIANKQRKAKGLKGLRGEAMAKEVEWLIRRRQGRKNFIRAGWIPAIKILEKLVPKKSGKSLRGTKQRGQPKGGAKAAISRMLDFSPIAYIWNEVWKLKEKGFEFMEQGANAAIAMETQSMKDYIASHQLAASKKFWGF